MHLKALALTFAMALGMTAQADAASLIVKTEGGVVQGFSKSLLGTSDRTVDVFLGVPYAASPVGERRFRKAQKVIGWEGIRDASVMPAMCRQPAGGSEDCLFVNIYRPANIRNGERLPVAVFAHGGANVAGSAARYDGSRLARNSSVIVVTVQYRLGAFGFLNIPGSDADAGNFGVTDIAEALRWVRRNIAGFGGDPKNVTLVSQSAGSTNACRLMVSRRASEKDLFDGVILQSEDCVHDVDTPEQSRERSKRFLTLVGCEQSSDKLACAQALSTEQVLEASRAIRTWNPVGEISAATLISRGQWNKVPVLLGSNRNEGRSAGAAMIGMSDDEYQGWVERLVGKKNAPRVLQRYPAFKYSSKYAIPYVAGDLITDSGMRGLGGCTNVSLARKLVKGGAPAVYFYQFEDPAAPSRKRVRDYENLDSHGTEMSYLWPDAFGMLPLSMQLSAQQQELAAQMRRRWGLFIRYKTPNTKDLPLWNTFARNAMMVFSPEKSSAVNVSEFDTQHKCSLWDALPVIMDRGEIR